MRNCTIKFLFVVSFIANISYSAAVLKDDEIIEDILYGVASSAYQVEGAHNIDGKSSSVWDRYTHEHPERISDGSNGDAATNAYFNIKRDVSALSHLGVDFYRFSISWPRILPSGYANEINRMGVRYYNNLIDELLFHNITPMVTMYHWDLPQSLQDLGGWTNNIMVDLFEDYARVLFDNFGERVPFWITFNEPRLSCVNGYGYNIYAPGVNASGHGEYLCVHNIIKAHARVYHLYKNEYEKIFKAKIGYVSDCIFPIPRTKSIKDLEATDIARQMYVGWANNPIFSRTGGYGPIVEGLVARRSKEQNFRRSRLPEFTTKEIEYIRGTADFMGVNYYTSYIVNYHERSAPMRPNWEDDTLVDYGYRDDWEDTTTPWLKINPHGLRSALNWIRINYNNIPVYITENGCTSANGEIRNKQAVRYFEDHLRIIHQSIKNDGCDIRAYTAWSLMDSFEWDTGYDIQFGLYKTDFNNYTITPRESAKFYKHLIKRVKNYRRTSNSGNLFSASAPVPTAGLAAFSAVLILILKSFANVCNKF